MNFEFFGSFFFALKFSANRTRKLNDLVSNLVQFEEHARTRLLVVVLVGGRAGVEVVDGHVADLLLTQVG